MVGYVLLNAFFMNPLEQNIQKQINLLDDNDAIPFHSKNVGDKYHTIGELYDFRKLYNAALFNEWAKNYDADLSGLSADIPDYNSVRPHYNVHKSWKHHDGEDCFGGGWFIVVAKLPDGQISNHYKAEDWDLFKVPEVPKALFEFDGHTGIDVLERLGSICV